MLPKARLLRQLTPAWIKRAVVSRIPDGRAQELGSFVLDKMTTFVSEIGGSADYIDEYVRPFVSDRGAHTFLSRMNSIHQHLQVAMTPHYESDLFEYYQRQEYLILLTFLSYPFRGWGCLTSHLEPYIRGSEKLDDLAILDYGAGLPYGAIHLLRSVPDKIKSVTLVDLDLVHTRLAEYLLCGLMPPKDLQYYRLADAEQLPDFGDWSFNLIYGKDIFEHLHEPEKALCAILDRAQPTCICYLDLRDHGKRHLQHVSPQLLHLREVLAEYRFVQTDTAGSLTEFTRVR